MHPRHGPAGLRSQLGHLAAVDTGQVSYSTPATRAFLTYKLATIILLASEGYNEDEMN